MNLMMSSRCVPGDRGGPPRRAAWWPAGTWVRWTRSTATLTAKTVMPTPADTMTIAPNSATIQRRRVERPRWGDGGRSVVAASGAGGSFAAPAGLLPARRCGSLWP